MYKLNYKEHIVLKQAAYLIMQNHNNKEYNSDKQNKQFIKYNQTLTILYRKPQSELLDIIDRYQTYIEKQTNIKLIDTNQRNIIIPKLKNITEQQLEHIIQQLQRLVVVLLCFLVLVLLCFFVIIVPIAVRFNVAMLVIL